MNQCSQKHLLRNVRARSRHMSLAAELLEQDPEDTTSKPAFASGSFCDFGHVSKFFHCSHL